MIIHLSGADRAAHPDLFKQLFRLRHDVFVVGRYWTLPMKGNLEIDQYDRCDAQYFFALDDDGRVCSHVRLTPSMSGSLLADCFAHLVEEGSIREPQIYEGTRYIVLPRSKARSCIRTAKAELLVAMFEWAQKNDVSHVQVMVETKMLPSFIEMTPAIRPLGLSHPYGGGPNVKGGGEAIAIRCPVNGAVIADLRAYGSLKNGVAVLIDRSRRQAA